MDATVGHEVDARGRHGRMRERVDARVAARVHRHVIEREIAHATALDGVGGAAVGARAVHTRRRRRIVVEIKLRSPRAASLRMTVARAVLAARARTSTTSARRSPPYPSSEPVPPRAAVPFSSPWITNASPSPPETAHVSYCESENVASRWRVHSREWSETWAA